MKLEKYEDKSNKKKKVLLISLGVIVLASVSLLLYKTFASFNEHAEFPMMKGKVDYFGNSDVYFVFYKGNELLNEMPGKDNEEGLVFERGSCDNGASIEWNESEWAPLVKGLTSPKTKCSLYFKVPAFDEEVIKCSKEGKTITTCITDNASFDKNLKIDDYGNLRYTGSTPNNFVHIAGTSTSKTWRIIGIIDGKLKIISSQTIGDKVWADSGDNTWSSSDIAKYLTNNYTSGISIITSGSWNVGGASSTLYPAKEFYNYEQQTKWTGNAGLITVSDYGYAVGGDVRETCLAKNIGNYSNDCKENNWIYKLIGSSNSLTMTASTLEGRVFYMTNFGIDRNYATNLFGIFPVIYIDANTRITSGNGSSNSPFELSM